MKTVTHTTKDNVQHSYELPFKIKCNVSGVEKVYTSAEYINNRIDKAGSLEAMLKGYVSRDAKKTIKVEVPKVVAAIEEIKAKVEETKNLFETLKEEVKDERPIAKRDARGILRNSKGHPIKKGTEELYQIAA